jgi:uncharacterized membrane protein YphA (DoxX/SURF4 family)
VIGLLIGAASTFAAAFLALVLVFLGLIGIASQRRP